MLKRRKKKLPQLFKKDTQDVTSCVSTTHKSQTEWKKTWKVWIAWNDRPNGHNICVLPIIHPDEITLNKSTISPRVLIESNYLFVWLYINNINHRILVISQVFMFCGGDHLQQMTVGTQNTADHRLLACEHTTSQASASLGRHTWYRKRVHVPLGVSWRCLWQATDSKCFTTHWSPVLFSITAKSFRDTGIL